MRSILLICKSWFKSILKLRFIFVLFIIINILFGAVLSTFLEVRVQIQKQINPNNTLNLKLNQNLAFNNPNNILKTQNLIAIFCTDYFEIIKKKKKKLISKLTVGEKNGCFKKPKNIKPASYKVLLYDLKNKPRIIYFGTNLKFKEDYKLEINKKSIYYQNSLHSLLLKKYDQTKDIQYLELATILKRAFEVIIINKMRDLLSKKAQKISLSREIRQNEINKFMSIRKIVNDIEKNQTMLFTKYISEKNNLIEYLNAQLISTNRQKLLKNLLNNLINKKESLIEESKKKTNTILSKMLKNIENWNNWKLLNEFNALSKEQILNEYPKFENNLNKKFDTNKENFKEFIFFVLTKPNNFRFVITWMKKQQKNYENKKETNQTKWLFANLEIIKIIIDSKITNNPLILTIKNIKKYLKLISTNDTFFKKKHFQEFNYNPSKILKPISFIEIQKKIQNQKENIILFLMKINEQIEKLTTLINKYEKIKQFIKNKLLWKSLIKRTKMFLERRYNKENRQNIENKLAKEINLQGLANFTNEKINEVYFFINEKIKQIALFNSKMIEMFYQIQKIKKTFGFKEKLKISIQISELNKEKKNYESNLWFQQKNQLKIDEIQITEPLNHNEINDSKEFIFLWENQEIKINKEENYLYNLNKIHESGYKILQKYSTYIDQKIKTITKKEKNNFLWLKNTLKFQIFEKLDLHKIYKERINLTELYYKHKTDKYFKSDMIFFSALFQLADTLKVIQLNDRWEEIIFSSKKKAKIVNLIRHESQYQYFTKGGVIESSMKEIKESIYDRNSHINLFKIFIEFEEKINKRNLNKINNDVKYSSKTLKLYGYDDLESRFVETRYHQYVFWIKITLLEYKAKSLKLNEKTQKKFDAMFLSLKKQNLFLKIKKENSWIFDGFLNTEINFVNLFNFLNKIRIKQLKAESFFKDANWNFIKNKILDSNQNFQDYTKEFAKKIPFIEQWKTKNLPSQFFLSEAMLYTLMHTKSEQVKENKELIVQIQKQLKILKEKGFNIDYYQFLYTEIKASALMQELLDKEMNENSYPSTPRVPASFVELLDKKINENHNIKKNEQLNKKLNFQTAKKIKFNWFSNTFQEYLEELERTQNFTQYSSWKNDHFFSELELTKRRNWINFIKLDNKTNEIVSSNIINFLYIFFSEQIRTESSDYNKIGIIIRQAIAKIYNFTTKTFNARFIRDTKKETNYLIVNNDKKQNLDLHLFSGNKILYDNEVIITPTYARSQNIKIGDILNFFGVKNLKVVGIGVQKEFYYPLISYFDIIPKKNDLILYTNENLFNIFIEKKAKSFPTNYIEKRNHFFLNYNIVNKKQQAKDFWFVNNYFGTKGFNTSKLLLKLNKIDETLIFDKDSETDDNDYIIWPISKFPFFPYGKMIYFVQTNYYIIFYSSLIITIFITLIIAFITFYLINKKIKMNLKQIGILKSLGMKNSKILWGAFPLIIFVILAIFIGWISSVFLQLIIFNKMETILNVIFDKYRFNFQNLFICLGISIGVIFTVFFLYEKIIFKKMTALKMILPTIKKNNKWINKFKEILLNKTSLNRFLIVKMNYLFFSIIWKKTITLLIIGGITGGIILSFVFIFGIKKETIKQNYKNTNYKWEINYLNGQAGNPWTRRIMYINHGYDNIKNTPENSLKPIENWGIQFIFATKDNIQTSPKIIYNFKKLFTIFNAFSPLYGKIMNYNWIMFLLKNLEGRNRKEKEIKFCKKLNNLFQAMSIKVGADKTEECITSKLDLVFPIKLNNKKKALKHFPMTMNAVNFNPKKDDFFTKLNAKITKKTDQKKDFGIYGISKTNKSFSFSKKGRKLLFQNKKNKKINVIANSVFLKQNNLKIGDTFKITYKKKVLKYAPTKKEIKDEDWYYEKDANTKIPLANISPNTRWYDSSKLNNIDNIEIKENKMFYLTKNKKTKVKLVYKDSKGNFQEWLDVEKIRLKLNDSKKKEKIISPFIKIEKEKEKIEDFFIKKTWWNTELEKKRILADEININSKKQFLIVDEIEEYNKSKIFIKHEIANELLGFNKNKNILGQYEWFNGKWSNEEKVENTFYNFSYASKLGFLDSKTIDTENGSTYMIKKIDAFLIKKFIIIQILDYFFDINLLFILSVSFTIILFFFLITIGTIKEVQKTNLELKVLGYSKRIIFLSCLQIIVFPIILGFFISSFLINYLFTTLLENLSSGLEIQFFFDNSIISFLIALTIILFFVSIIIWNHFKTIKNANLTKIWYN